MKTSSRGLSCNHFGYCKIPPPSSLLLLVLRTYHHSVSKSLENVQSVFHSSIIRKPYETNFGQYLEFCSIWMNNLSLLRNAYIPTLRIGLVFTDLVQGPDVTCLCVSVYLNVSKTILIIVK